MARTKKGERLSLRDTLLRWCDPALVQNIRAVEAEFSVDQIMAACPCNLEGTAPSVRDRAEVDPVEVERARQRFRQPWNSLVADLHSRIMASRIELAGVPTGSSPPAPAKRIPPSYAAKYDFDFILNTVRWHHGGWTDVTASLSTEAAHLDDDASQPFPLKAALLTWSDELLVDPFETAQMVCQLANEVRRGRLPASRERLYAGVSVYDIEPFEPQWRGRLEPARTELIADFRARISRGEIQLTGLQTEPVLALEPGPLSPAWAERMQFDWQRQTTRVEGALFVDVVAVVREARLPVKSKAINQPARRGRPSFPMEKLIAIACDRQDVRISNRKREADALLAEFQRRHPSVKPPAVRTIEDHEAEIYVAAVGNAGTVKTLK